MKEQKITKGTIVRTACLILALANMVLKATGHDVLPIDDAQMNAFVTDGFVMVTALVAWWKNNSFTHSAKQGDAVKRELKAANKIEREA